MKPTLSRLIDFQRLLLQLSQIERMVHRPHKGDYTQENDTEHSYNLAMTAWFLCQGFPNLNKDEVMRFALIHDLVEVHAGDTYIYASQEDLDSKASRESMGRAKLANEWSDFPELVDYIQQYYTCETEEAKFVYALDKIMPSLLIYIGDGYTWKKHELTNQMLHVVKHKKVMISPEIEAYYNQLHKILEDTPELFYRSSS